MTGSSEHEIKEGLRCGQRNVRPIKIFFDKNKGVEVCSGLLFEHDPKNGLGIRCYKKECRNFYPLEVLLSQAAEQELLSSEQLERIRIAVSKEEKPENSGVYPELAEEEQEMVTEAEHKEIRENSVIEFLEAVITHTKAVSKLSDVGESEKGVSMRRIVLGESFLKVLPHLLDNGVSIDVTDLQVPIFRVRWHDARGKYFCFSLNLRVFTFGGSIYSNIEQNEAIHLINCNRVISFNIAQGGLEVVGEGRGKITLPLSYTTSTPITYI